MSFFSYAHNHRSYFEAHGTRVGYKKGQYVVTPLDESPWVFFVLEGAVQASVVVDDGSERLIGYFMPGTSFAKSGSFFADDNGALEYIAKEKSVLLRLPRVEFLQQLRVDSDFNNEYIDLILKNQIFLIDRILYQGEVTLDTKFVRWVAFMVKYYSEPVGDSQRIVVQLNQQDIANFLHVTRVSVGKVVKKYSQLRAVKFSGKYMTVDLPKLGL